MTSTAPIVKTCAMEWGRLVMTAPPRSGEPADIRIEFHPTLVARREAFLFVQEMYRELTERFSTQNVDAKVEFIRASDHYHLLISDRVVAEANVAVGLTRAISHGAMSGQGTGRSVSTTITGKHRIVDDFVYED